VRRLVVVLTVVALLVAACGDDGDGAAQDTTTSTTSTPAAPSTSSDGVAGAGAADGPVELAVTDVATDLDTVWALAFDPDGKLWFTQRDGRLQQVGGKGRDIPGVVAQGEGGLMGLEIDDRGRFFLMLTTRSDNRIIRLDTLDAEPVVLVDGIRKAAIHNGGRLRFGPDGTLYAGTGDAGDTSLPPKADSLSGKILAIDPDSGDAKVLTRGHRNPQGLCFDAGGRFLSTEHGPDRGDEVNVIEEGQDYGWPDSSGTGIKNWTPTIAPGGCVVYTDDRIPQWTGSMLFTTLKQKDLRRLTFAADGSVADEEILYDDEYGRLRDVVVGPDGAVYLGTSSKDSRGNPEAGDDRILKISP
jgi:glucose/arabinose dehydrogenase